MHAAVFVDFENLFASLKNRSELSGHRIRDLALSILDKLKTRLQSEGSPMVLGRSYAAFDVYPGMEVAHDLALMGFDPQYVLIGPAGKNAADVQLAVDVCRVLFRRADIEAIVIVSGDRDFIPIARQVLEENRELRLVAIPDATSGDLRMRVGAERFWNALDLLPAPAAPAALAAPAAASAEPPATESADPRVPDRAGLDALRREELAAAGAGSEPAHTPPAETSSNGGRAGRSASIVGHIPVTWRTGDDASEQQLLERLYACVDLLVKAQIRHGSREIWLSPFLKGPMSQQFRGLVHPERRALVNELRNRGVIRVEERENQFADHPYSVIVLNDGHPLVQAAVDRARKG
jgi:hypothetical protein